MLFLRYQMVIRLRYQGYDIRWWSEFYNLIHRVNLKVKI